MFKNTLLPALRFLALFTVLTGLAYPLAVTGAAQALFPFQANGSLVAGKGQKTGGSLLIGQEFKSDKYFHARPSANTYNPIPSGGSNLGPTSAELKKQVQQRREDFRKINGLADDAEVPNDMLFASASGLDPHISPQAARLQVNRVAKARRLSASQTAKLKALVRQSVEPPQMGFLGQERVNVLALNRALDQAFPGHER